MRSAKNRPKTQKLYLLVFALIVAVFGVVLLFQSRAAEQSPPPPTVYLTPTDLTHAANETFSVNVRANSGNDTVNQVTAVFTYPTDLLEFINVDTTGTAFPTKATIKEENGKVSIPLGVDPNVAQSVSGDQFVAKVTFRTKTAAGVANLSFTPETTLYRVPDFVNLVSDVSRNKGASFTIDTSAPTVSITAPANNTQVGKGETLTITVNAQDDSQVSTVTIFIDNAPVKTFNANETYQYSWSTSNAAFGQHTIRATASDGLGNEGTSETINVQIVDNVKPSVSITQPQNGDTVHGTVSLSANANDNQGGSGISKVEFYVNNQLVGSADTTAPYSATWDTTSLPDGNYTITAKAYDKANPANIGETNQAVSVTVSNSDNESPTTPTNLRFTHKSLDSITLEWDASTDNEGVIGYRITRNGVPIDTVAELTYTDTGLTDGTVYNYTVAALDANSNSSNVTQLSVATNELKVGDFNRDELVNLDDLAMLLWSWMKPDPVIDIDQSGTVDPKDLSILLYEISQQLN